MHCVRLAGHKDGGFANAAASVNLFHCSIFNIGNGMLSVKTNLLEIEDIISRPFRMISLSETDI
jgi:hypothetical protein